MTDASDAEARSPDPPSDVPCSKKRKEAFAPDWMITFEDASALQNVTESLYAVMNRVTFRAKRIGDHFYLKAEGADPGQTCFVNARLKIDKVEFRSRAIERDYFEFRVDCKQFLYSIRDSTCSQGTLTIQDRPIDAKIVIKIHDPDMPSHTSCSMLNTFVEPEQTDSLNPLNFKLIVEIGMKYLKEILKKAKDADAETMELNVRVKPHGSKYRSITTFTVKGETQHVQEDCADASKAEDGSMIVRANGDGEANEEDDDDSMDEHDCDISIRHTYPIQKIHAFVKNMHQTIVVAKMEQGMPLMLEHGIAGSINGESYVQFFVAPVNDDD